MRFRPCIDIHNGKVKQIVGSSLSDSNDRVEENFVAERDAAEFASLYKNDGLSGGHVIMLNPTSSPFYSDTKAQALTALNAFQGGLQVGGSITPKNAAEFLDAGASHVIVTSYVFKDGMIYHDRLSELSNAVGKRRLVLDLSCRRRGDDYYIVTDRWQSFTNERVTLGLLERLSKKCDEFLIHAVDVEGKNSGIEENLLELLALFEECPVTYAGGVRNEADIERIRQIGRGRIDFTVGSALDIFGGAMSYESLARHYTNRHAFE